MVDKSIVEEKRFIDSTICMSYREYVIYITPIIIMDLYNRGWISESKNKVLVRYIANGKWDELLYLIH